MYSCAVTSLGAVKCWGSNISGQLGNDSLTDSHVPVDVVGLSSGVLHLSVGGGHTCAVTKAGAVKCWGLNFLGQLGDGSSNDSLVPVAVVGLSGAISLSTGSGYTCVRTKASTVACWGPELLDLGNTPTAYSSVPVEVMGL